MTRSLAAITPWSGSLWVGRRGDRGVGAAGNEIVIKGARTRVCVSERRIPGRRLQVVGRSGEGGSRSMGEREKETWTSAVAEEGSANS